MGLKASCTGVSPNLHHDGSHEEGDEGNESHEGHEKDLCKPCEASRLCRQGCQDWLWLEEGRPREEQGRQDCQQEEERTLESQPLDCCVQSRTCSLEDQRFRRHQEGIASVQQGQGALQEEVSFR